METKDIKSTKKKERVLGWKENLKLAFQQNKFIDPKNLSDKEKKYWEELQKSDTKKKKPKVTLLDKAKILKEKIIENANTFADRILNKAIAKEEQTEAWEKKKEELKAEADKKRKEAALKKREEKAKKLISIHATIPSKDTSKKQKRIERNKKRAIKLIHHKEVKDEIKHTTAEKREANAAENRRIAYQNYLAEMQRQQSEKEADPKAVAERKEKRLTAKKDRMQMLAEKRLKRMERLQIVELTQKQKLAKDLEHFKQAQEARNAKKKEQRAKYLTKGGEKVPKVKNKVDVRPTIIEEKIDNKHRYLTRTQYIGKNAPDGETVGAITCIPTKLKDIVKYNFNKLMEKESDNLIGIFIYDSDNPEVCVMEMVNSKYREIDGVTTTRMNQEKQAA